MRVRRFSAVVGAAIVVTGLAASPSLAATASATTASAASRTAPTKAVTVDGAVTSPASYTAAQLAALPQTTLPLAPTRKPSGSVTGVSLLALVNDSVPELPDAKNAELRVSVTVSGADHQAVTLALGELDPAFGDHDALLVASSGRHSGGATLVVPGDRDGSRSIAGVDAVRVAVAAADPSDVTAGSLVIRSGRRSLTLSPAQLAHLPTRTLTVSFQAGTGPQQHTETGPDLLLVLLRAGLLPTRTTAVLGVGDDGYLATVTSFEELTGGRPLLVSTVEDGVPLERPRLVVDGDVKGGRYVSDLTDLVVTRY